MYYCSLLFLIFVQHYDFLIIALKNKINLNLKFYTTILTFFLIVGN